MSDEVKTVIRALEDASTTMNSCLELAAIQATNLASFSVWQEPNRTVDYPVGLVVNKSLSHARLG